MCLAMSFSCRMGEAKRAGRVASHQALPIRSFSGAASSSAALTETTSVRPCGRDVDGKCRSVATRRYASLDQLFIRIEKKVTGRLDMSRSRSLNGCENEMVVRVVRTVIGFLPFAGKPMHAASAQKPLELRSDSRLSGKKFSPT
jgi:hypothetical protein